MKKVILILVLFSVIIVYSTSTNRVRSRMHTTDFMWYTGISLEAEHLFNKGWPEYRFLGRIFRPILTGLDYIVPKKMSKGDIVYLRPSQLHNFHKFILMRTNNPVVLVLAGSDKSTPSDLNIDFEEVIAHPMVYHCFIMNCDYLGNSNKISSLPIGIDFHSLTQGNHCGEKPQSTKEQEIVLQRVIKETKPFQEREQKVYVDFHLNDTSKRFKDKGYETRTDVMNYFKDAPFIAFQEEKMRREDQWRERAKYAFSLCHFGNGMDCHRTWESLALGSIVIVKSSPLDPLYEGLPVVIVDDWSEVCESNLQEWSELYHDTLTNSEYRQRLTHRFWMDKIAQKSNECKNLL